MLAVKIQPFVVVAQPIRLYTVHYSGNTAVRTCGDTHRQADYAEKESGVNSMAFIDKKYGGVGGGGGGGGSSSGFRRGETDGVGVTLLATGGEDGVLRVWELRADGQGECERNSLACVLEWKDWCDSCCVNIAVRNKTGGDDGEKNKACFKTSVFDVVWYVNQADYLSRLL